VLKGDKLEFGCFLYESSPNERHRYDHSSDDEEDGRKSSMIAPLASPFQKSAVKRGKHHLCNGGPKHGTIERQNDPGAGDENGDCHPPKRTVLRLAPYQRLTQNCGQFKV
jgi:hypothetical protein